LPVLFSASALLSAADPVSVLSPDGQVEIRLTAGSGRMSYAVAYRGAPVLLESGLGLTLEGSGSFGAGMTVLGVRRSSRQGFWKPVYGERSLIPENYREAVVELQESAAPGRKLRIALRAYNEGAAWRYEIPAQEGLANFVVLSEQTEFHLPAATRAWQTHTAQRPYENVWVKDVLPQCERPLVIEYPDGRFAALFEAGLRNYARMLFSPVAGKPGVLVSDLSGGPSAAFAPDFGEAAPLRVENASKPYVWGSAPFVTPWRGVLVGDRAGDLIERNYLLLNLNEPPRLGDTSWIKPGKVIREVTLSTKGGKECVDFAKRRNLQYIEFDAGWYGHEYDDAADARSVRVDPLRLRREPEYQGLDLPEVIRYAKQNGVGVLLYVNRRALERQLSSILPLYEKWGVAGVKFGFVNVGSQFWTKWLYDAVELAGKHRLMVDIHDEHRPTGLSRTYPHLMTQEGIAGNETMPSADHNTVLPFTRFLAGAADYTICYYNDRIKTTRAHQLALAVVYYSPLQFVYWYDRPSAYQGEPEIEFFDRVPTVWDDTKLITGEIGRYASVARRSGEHWFVGTINNSVPRRLKIALNFLPSGRAFTAHIYENGRGGPRDVQIRKLSVTSSSVIDATLPPAGGQAIWLEPASERARP
jgi:alpha-glucosidase